MHDEVRCGGGCYRELGIQELCMCVLTYPRVSMYAHI